MQLSLLTDGNQYLLVRLFLQREYRLSNPF
jgi:hypothetical protein